MYGCPFGLGSVVLTFNRLPALMVAMTRRILCVIHAAYFDDNIVMDAAPAAHKEQHLVQDWFGRVGTPPKPEKSFPMGPCRVVLGVLCEISAACDDSFVVLQPREKTRWQVLDGLQRAVDTRYLTSGDASKLRGRAGWVASNSYGRIGRLGAQCLKQIQYVPGRAGSLDAEQVMHLNFHRQLVAQMGPRVVHLQASSEYAHIAYTDAEYTAGQQPRVGGILFAKNGDQPRGATGLISFAQMRQWEERKQQIYLAELTAVPWLIAREAATLRGDDVIIFVDNEAAVASLVRVSSVTKDAALVVQVVHALLTFLQCRAWFEWIDSHSNQADGLSRDGLNVPQARGPTPAWKCGVFEPVRPWSSDESPWRIARELLELRGRV